MATVKKRQRSRNAERLSSTAFTVLGMLSFGRPLAGYELRQWADEMVGHFFATPAQSQIYSELRWLEANGLVTSQTVDQTTRPDKTIYAITESGEEALATWITNEPIAETRLKHHQLLRIFLGHNTSTEHLVQALTKYRDVLRAALDELEELSVAMGGDPLTGLAALTAEWTADIFRGDLCGVERAIEQLTANTPGASVNEPQRRHQDAEREM